MQTELGRLPITEAVAQACLTGLVEKHATLSTDLSGYQQWRTALDAGEAGVVAASLAQIVEALEEAINANAEAMRVHISTDGLFEKRNLN
ncbi:MAG: hypothetical protein JWQ08_2804 [Deinococcus sp.]|nr:hypothetical protein [Deinococcus sp.]